MRNRIIAVILFLVFAFTFTGCNTAGYNNQVKAGETSGADSFSAQAEISGSKEEIAEVSLFDTQSAASEFVPAQKTLLGICERTVDTTSNIDNGATADLVADLSGALGADAFRVWMHYSNIITVNSNNTLSIKADVAAVYRSFIAKLRAKGVTRIMAMSHYYVLPYGITGRVTGQEIPLIGTSDYYRFLEMVEDTLFLLATTFPEISFWEPGNEPDLANAFVTKLPQDSAGSNLFTKEELAKITMDISFYANKGIKAVSASNKLVMPGLIFEYESEPDVFIGMLYSQIKSGNLPSGTKYAKSTNEDLYFDIACWHPYLAGSRKVYQRWVDGSLKMYEVMKNNGDAGKDVFFSEFGYTDYDEKNQIESNEFIYENQYKLIQVFDTIREKMPFVKTVFMFRLLNWEYNIAPTVGKKEKYFGLFFSPQEAEGCLPKPSAIQLFYYFNGYEADISPLFKYVV